MEKRPGVWLAVFAVLILVSFAYCSAQRKQCAAQNGHLVSDKGRNVCQPNPKESTK